MGYEREILEGLVTMLRSQLSNLSGVDLLELGNQEVYSRYEKVLAYYQENGYTHTMDRRIVKPFFEHLGLRVTQIDYNGKDGALALDVRKDIMPYLTKKFKVVTNVGFTEHVGEYDIMPDKLLECQYAVFKNLHDVGDVGAIYFHCVPLNHFWHKHGVCDYSLEFFEKLCHANNYQILKGPYVEIYHPEKQAAVFYKKISDSPFITFEQFSSLPGLRSTCKD